MAEPTELEIYHELRAACLEVFERHGISEEYIRFDMLLSRHQVRDAVIRREYQEARPGETDAKRAELANNFRLAERHVCRIVYS